MEWGRLQGRLPWPVDRNCQSAAGVPGILQLAEALDFHIAAGFEPGFYCFALGIAGLGGIHSLGNDAAAVVRDIAFAIQAIGLDAAFDEVVQELLALGSCYVALVIKGKFKAEFLELTNAVFLAESLIHGAVILRIFIASVNQKHYAVTDDEVFRTIKEIKTKAVFLQRFW